MNPRSVWKGFLQVVKITCPVKLYKATEELKGIGFTWINRKTGNRLKQLRVDSLTGKEVEEADVVKGVEIGPGKYVEVTPEEIADAAPASLKLLKVKTFVKPAEIEAAHLEDHYFLGPDGEAAQTAFALIRLALERQKLVGLGTLCLGTHERLVALMACGKGMALASLRAAAEVRCPDDYFAKLPAPEIPAELLRLMDEVVIDRTTAFDARHSDRYQVNLAELRSSKIEGKTLAPSKPPAAPKMTDLAAAVRKSAEKPKRRAG